MKDQAEVEAALHVAVSMLASIRHEVRWSKNQATLLDIAIERGAKALDLPVPVGCGAPSTQERL